MTTKRLATLLVALPAIVLFAACSGGTTNGNDGGSTQDAGTQDAGTTDAGTQDAGTTCVTQSPITIDGTVAVHPVSVAIASATQTTVTLDNTTLAMARASGLLNPNNPDPYLSYSDDACTPVMGNITPNTSDPTAAAFTYPNVNADNVLLGIVAVVDNQSGSSTFVNTATGIAAPPTSGPFPDVHGAHVFAVTNATVSALAAINPPMTTQDLLKKGFILGTFVDASNNPIEGVTLTDSNGTAIPQAFYPNATFTGLTTTGATSANGVFVVSNVQLGSYTGSKGTMTFTSQEAATVPNSCFVMFLTGS